MQTANSLEKTLMLGKTEAKRRSGWQKMGWLDSITDSMDVNLSKLQKTVEDRGAWRVIVHAVTKSWTQLSNWTITTTTSIFTDLTQQLINIFIYSVKHTWYCLLKSCGWSLYSSIMERAFFLQKYLFIYLFWPHHTACGILVPWPGSANHWTIR